MRRAALFPRAEARSGPGTVLALVGTLCNDDGMAKTVIVKLTDDIDGGDADETVFFGLDGKSYEIDVSTGNAAKLRGALEPFIDKARTRMGRREAGRRERIGRRTRPCTHSSRTTRRPGSVPGRTWRRPAASATPG